MILRKMGYEILVAGNGVEALAILDHESKKGKGYEIECILMDASMDVMNGLDCTRVIRSQQLPNRTRPFIIAQTANVTEEYRQLCLLAEMDLFLSKVRHTTRVENAKRCDVMRCKMDWWRRKGRRGRKAD